MKFRPIVGSLVYLWDKELDQVLIIRRDARTDDDHFGKINGLGGKVEIDEDIVSSARREVREESGLDATTMQLRGTITFSDFGPKREQWLVFTFLATSWTGTPLTKNDEGSLEWVDRTDLLEACEVQAPGSRLPMWAGDRHFVPLVFDDDPRAFHGTMPYDADVPLRWSHVRI